MTRWSRICLAVQGMWVLIPGRGTKILHASGQLNLHAVMKTQNDQKQEEQEKEKKEGSGLR